MNLLAYKAAVYRFIRDNRSSLPFHDRWVAAWPSTSREKFTAILAHDGSVAELRMSLKDLKILCPGATEIKRGRVVNYSICIEATTDEVKWRYRGNLKVFSIANYRRNAA